MARTQAQSRIAFSMFTVLAGLIGLGVALPWTPPPMHLAPSGAQLSPEALELRVRTQAVVVR